VSVRVFYRYGTIFREAFKALDVDYCGLMDGSKPNLVFQSFVDNMKSSVPDFFHNCPYLKGWYNLSIVVDPEKFHSIMPTGLYKFDFNISGKYGRMFSFEQTSEFKSEIRTSF
jgi:hypothetical protein